MCPIFLYVMAKEGPPMLTLIERLVLTIEWLTLSLYFFFGPIYIYILHRYQIMALVIPSVSILNRR